MLGRTSKSGDKTSTFLLEESIFLSPKRETAFKSFDLHNTDSKDYKSATNTGSSRDNLQKARIKIVVLWYFESKQSYRFWKRRKDSRPIGEDSVPCSVTLLSLLKVKADFSQIGQ